MKVFAIWLDGGGSHEPSELMSLWTTRELAATEIERLQRDVYVYGGPPVQRFWLTEVEVDKPYDQGAEDTSGTEPYPPWE